jgi:Lrp/AsnC family leucine-responsive transcriptional regulator
MQFDDLDFKILNILQKDSTLSIKDLAAKIKLSFTPTYERIKKMEENGVIDKYIALVNREKVGLGLLVYCNITLKTQSKKALMDFEKNVSKFEQVLEVISISGTYDYMLKIVAKDVNDYNDFVVNSISNIPNIGQYHSNIVLKEIKKETAFYLK